MPSSGCEISGTRESRSTRLAKRCRGRPIAGDVSRAPAKNRATWLPWIAVATLALGVGVWEARRPMTAPKDPLANAQFSRFTDWEGAEGAADISPDGRFVVFVADHAGEFDLWLKQVGTGDFTNLTTNIAPLGGPHPLLRTFGFSGDGAEIWFSLAGDPIRERKMFDPPDRRHVTRVPERGRHQPCLVFRRHASRLFSRKDLARTPPAVIPCLSQTAQAANARQILAPEEGRHNHNPVWSQDDQWLYFVHGLVRGLNWTDEMDVWRVRPSGGSLERLTHHHTAVTSWRRSTRARCSTWRAGRMGRGRGCGRSTSRARSHAG